MHKTSKAASMNIVKTFSPLYTPGNINYSDCASQCDTAVLQYIWLGRNLLSKAAYETPPSTSKPAPELRFYYINTL